MMEEALRISCMNCGFCTAKNHCAACGRELTELLLIPNPATGAELQALIRALVLQDFTGGGVMFRHVPSVTVTTPEEFPWTLDGEYGSGAEKVEIMNLPKRLQFLL